MFDWKNLINEPIGNHIKRGTLIKLKDDSWRDETVVLMICEWIGNVDYPFSVVRVSGSKSGINPLQLIPATALYPEITITIDWLIENWNDWIWLESDVSTAMICYGPVPVECF